MGAGLALAVGALGLGLLAPPFAPPPTTPAVPDWRTDPEEPYPFTTPVPALLPTPIDGSYDRPPTENYPDRPGCTRCQPFPLDAGRSVLTFTNGRYYLAQQQPRYETMGHYTIEETELTLLNDPECGTVRGTYRWQLADGHLTLTVLDDECGFGQRARDLTDRVWETVSR